MTALQFINFIAASELPVAEAAGVFKPEAVPAFEDIIDTAHRYRLHPKIAESVGMSKRLTEIIEWAKESQS